MVLGCCSGCVVCLLVVVVLCLVVCCWFCFFIFCVWLWFCWVCICGVFWRSGSFSLIVLGCCWCVVFLSCCLVLWWLDVGCYVVLNLLGSNLFWRCGWFWFCLCFGCVIVVGCGWVGWCCWWWIFLFCCRCRFLGSCVLLCGLVGLGCRWCCGGLVCLGCVCWWSVSFLFWFWWCSCLLVMWRFFCC